MTSHVTVESPEPEFAGPHRWQIRPWARIVRRMTRGYAYTRWVDRYCRPLTVRGAEHFDDIDGPCLVIANHQSHMDTLVLQPWYQSLVLGNFPIRRGGGSAALEHAGWLLERGRHLAIFPEGTRAITEALGRFRAGAALLALAHDVPVVPVYLSGLREMRPKGARELVAGPAGVEFLEPVRFAPRHQRDGCDRPPVGDPERPPHATVSATGPRARGLRRRRKRLPSVIAQQAAPPTDGSVS